MTSAYRETPGKIDLSMSGWVMQVIGTAAILGKVQDESEEELRKEIADHPFRVAVVTLFPVYIAFTQLCFVMSGPGKVNAQPFRFTDTPERTFFSKGKNQPMHVALTAFAFLSDKPEDERKTIIKSIEDFEQAMRIAEIGIVAGG